MIGRTRATSLIGTAMALAFAGCAVKPKPLTTESITSRVEDVLARVTADQEPVGDAIDLYEAMARALKYNLDHRVELMEAALRAQELELAHYSLLPNVVASSGYAARDSFNASNSVNILTGAESLSTSTSQEKKIKTADVAFAWNVLDFGLSYVRARQAADKFLIAEELKRKVVHRIIEDVRTAYWRAVSADRLIKKLRTLETRVAKAQKDTKAISAERQTSPITAVTYERELVEIKRSIQELERDLTIARTQLSSLINLRPGAAFTLVHPGKTTSSLVVKLEAKHLVETALRNRAEMREVWYRQRINDQELDAAFLELLPGLQIYAGTNFDSNEYLYNNNWLNWGAKAGWNLMRLIQYPAKEKVIEAQDALLDQRGLAVAMAIMTQVHVSRVRFYHYRKELDTASEYLDVQSRLINLMRTEAGADRISEQTLIREEMNTLVAEVKRDIAYANLQNAFANVYASTGLDPYASELDTDLSVNDLAAALRHLWFERGDAGAGSGLKVANSK
jgi:outer membrane protein TolC